MDRGHVPEELRRAATCPASPEARRTTSPSRSREPPRRSGIPDAFLRELIDFGLVTTRAGETGPELSPLDVQIARTAWDLRRYGVEPRHLRMYANCADREAALFGQILTPAYRHKTAESRARPAADPGRTSARRPPAT